MFFHAPVKRQGGLSRYLQTTYGFLPARWSLFLPATRRLSQQQLNPFNPVFHQTHFLERQSALRSMWENGTAGAPAVTGPVDVEDLGGL